ncbi:MAG: cadherin-like domain-containing protein [Lentisphaerae bacterium]|nr:cadherin-like domain-containing protein [Lentisphaerota bacterium]
MLSGNYADEYGAAVFTGGIDSATTLVNCTLVNNRNAPTAFASGGAVFVYSGEAILQNSVVAFNSSGLWRSGWGGAASLSFSHCNVYGNTNFNIRFEGAPVTPDPIGSDGNLAQDPLFADSAAGNWRLTNVSPCVNAGSNEYVAAGATDADGLSRIVPVGGTVDMGAYELRDAPPVAVAQSITLPEDGVATVVLTAWDVDDDPLTYEIVAGPAHGTLSGSAPNLIYTPDPDYFGSDQVTFQAHDGTAPSTAAAVTLTVTPVNDAPEVIGLWVPAVAEGRETTLTATLGDVDDHSLAVIVTWGDGSAAESFAAGPGAFAATHRYAASGTFTVGIQVHDAAGLSTTASASVMVANVAPSVTLGGGGTLSEGDAFVGSGSFADPGTDTWSATVDYGDGSGSRALELDGSGFVLEHIYLDQGTYAVTVTVTDSDGDSGSATTAVVVLNAAPSVTAGSCGAINEGDAFVTSGSFTDPGVNDTWSATVDYGDGSGVQDLALDGGAFLLGHTYLNQGLYTVTVTVADDDGGSGSDVIVVDVANVTPVIGSLQAPVEPLAAGLLVETSATFVDPGMLDDHTAMWSWGDGETSTGTVRPQDDGQYLVTGEHVYQTPGVYTVTLDVLDDGDTGADDDFRYVVIYDAEGGFVTGGGWIISPEGAFAPDLTLTGKATFGFVAKYTKGQQIPSGQTQFDFALAGLSFHSTAYAWLVVAGPHSKYKGTGTINGSAGFGFMLTATDGQRSGGGGVDRFRIKIWDETTGEVVYDNQMGADDDSPAATALGGGSIVIHDK